MPAGEAQTELVIVGAGPAGCAAALAARRAGVSVQMIDRATFPRAKSCAGWIGPKGVALCEALEIKPATVGAVVFSDLRLHSWDFKKSATVQDPELSGWLVDRRKFDDALVTLAKKAGAKISQGCWATELKIGESFVAMRLNTGGELRAKIVLIADGADSPTARLAQLPDFPSGDVLPAIAIASLTEKKAPSGVDIVIGGQRALQVATIVRAGGETRITIMTRDRTRAAHEQLEELLAAATAAGVIADGRKASSDVGRAVAGAALDLETHVGKRSLLIGDAGGFVASFSNEGIYPAMKSGVIAGEVAAGAVKARVPQDELATFGARWRAELADYLRMPNIDLSLLLPLVFNNAQMSRRIARAFLLGQSF